MSFVSVSRHCAALAALVIFSQVALGCSKPTEPAPVKVVAASVAWDDTKSHLFGLKLATLTQLSGSPASPALVLESGIELSLRGPKTARRALIKLVNPHFVDAAGNPAPETSALAAELEKPFAVELSRGIISAYFEAPSPAAPIAGFRRHIASVFQLGEHAAEPSWKGVEWDATGLGNVEYRVVPGTSDTWDWKKLGYERVVVADRRSAQALDTTKVTPKVESAIGRLVTDAAGIVSIERKEKLSVPISASTTLTTDITLKLDRTRFGNAASGDQWEQLLNDLPRSEVGSPAPTGDSALADRARIGSHTFPELVTKLSEQEARKGSARATVSEAGPLFHALVGIFRQQPEQIESALKLVRARSPIAETLLDALAMASSEPALASLGQLAFDVSLPEGTRARAAGSMIRAQDPTAGALELAVKMIDDPLLREHGLFGTGSFVRQLRDKGNALLADAGTQALAKQLKSGNAKGDLATVLLAVSNSGSAELYAAAVSYQKNADDTVRHAAIQAIRLMPQPEVEVRLREVLGSKEHGDVVAALHALGRRPKATRESVDRVENIARTDTSADVRREAVLVLGLWSQLWPSLVPVLAELRAHDPEQRVRDVAKPVAAQ